MKLETHLMCTLPTSPRTAEDFNEAFRARAAWGRGDCGGVIHIDGGRRLWVWGDTLLGCPWKWPSMTRNSLVFQENETFIALFGPGQTTPLLSVKGGDAWLWPTGGVQRGEHVLMLAGRFRPGGPWGFEGDGMELVVYNWRSREVVSTKDVTVLDPEIDWSGSCTSWGGKLYIYGWKPSTWQCMVATVTDEGVVEDTVQVQIERPPFRSPYVERAGHELLMSSRPIDGVEDSQIGPEDVCIQLWTGDDPKGPFTHVGDYPTPPIPAGWMGYAGRVHRISVERSILMQSTNTTGTGLVPSNAEHQAGYGPHFAEAEW